MIDDVIKKVEHAKFSVLVNPKSNLNRQIVFYDSFLHCNLGQAGFKIIPLVYQVIGKITDRYIETENWSCRIIIS